MARSSVRLPLPLAVYAYLLQELSHGAGCGRDLATRCEARPGGARLLSGALYPALQRLARQGYIESTADELPPTSGPGRRTYRLTALGRERAAQNRAAVLALFSLGAPPASDPH